MDNKYLSIKHIVCVILLSTYMTGQETKTPVISVIPLDYDLSENIERDILKKNISHLIRGEIIKSERANLVDREQEITALSLVAYSNGVRSDSIAKEIGLKNGATHLITWSLRTSKNKYHFDFKHYNISSNSGSIPRAKWLKGALRFRFSINKNIEELKLTIRKSTWLVLGTTPPEGRFPEDSFLTNLWFKIKIFTDSFLFWLEMSYGIGYVIFLLVMISSFGGYGVYTVVTGGGESQSAGMGFPPEYPEGN